MLQSWIDVVALPPRTTVEPQDHPTDLPHEGPANGSRACVKTQATERDAWQVFNGMVQVGRSLQPETPRQEDCEIVDGDIPGLLVRRSETCGSRNHKVSSKVTPPDHRLKVS